MGLWPFARDLSRWTPERLPEPPLNGPRAVAPRGPGSPSKHQRKQERREEKLRRDAHRPLDGWERLRFLTDLVDTSRRLVDAADHKARFALVIMGALNAALLLFWTRAHVVDSVPRAVKPWLFALMVPYALVTFAFLLRAIEVLRPHREGFADDLAEARRLRSWPGDAGYDEQPLGLLYWTEILRKDLGTYRRLWSEARLGQLNAELAVLAHGLAHINQKQYTTLRRLFRGLEVMTALGSAALALLAIFSYL